MLPFPGFKNGQALDYSCKRPCCGSRDGFAIIGDIIYAAEGASFRLLIQRQGCPRMAPCPIFSRMIGLSRSRELILTNRRLKASEALDWGLVNRVVPDGDLLSEVALLAKSFAEGPTRSFGMAKRLLNESFSTTLETQMEHEARGIAEMSKSRDGIEGIKAFAGKRRPLFSGC